MMTSAMKINKAGETVYKVRERKLSYLEVKEGFLDWVILSRDLTSMKDEP